MYISIKYVYIIANLRFINDQSQVNRSKQQQKNCITNNRAAESTRDLYIPLYVLAMKLNIYCW